jgi:hypothetical protein
MQQINIALPKKYRPRIASKRRKPACPELVEGLLAPKKGFFSRRRHLSASGGFIRRSLDEGGRRLTLSFLRKQESTPRHCERSAAISTQIANRQS